MVELYAGRTTSASSFGCKNSYSISLKCEYWNCATSVTRVTINNLNTIVLVVFQQVRTEEGKGLPSAPLRKEHRSKIGLFCWETKIQYIQEFAAEQLLLLGIGFF